MGLAVSTGCQYFRATSFPQTLDLGLRVNKLGRSSVVYEVGIFSASGDDDHAGPAAVVTFIHVFVDSKNRKPCTISSQLRQGLQRIMVTADGDNAVDSKL